MPAWSADEANNEIKVVAQQRMGPNVYDPQSASSFELSSASAEYKMDKGVPVIDLTAGYCRRKDLMAGVRKSREKLCASEFHPSKTRKTRTQSGRRSRPLLVCFCLAFRRLSTGAKRAFLPGERGAVQFLWSNQIARHAIRSYFALFLNAKGLLNFTQAPAVPAAPRPSCFGNSRQAAKAH